MGVLPFFPSQHMVGQALAGPNAAADKGEAVPGAQPFPAALLRAAPAKAPGQLRNCDSSLPTPLKKQTSLLGEPPKEIRLSTNPYLNLASVLPGICLPEAHKLVVSVLILDQNLIRVVFPRQALFFVFPAAIASKASSPPQQTSLASNVMDAAVSQGTASQHAMENYFTYPQQPGEYPQEAVQQWYQHYAHSTQARVDGLESEASEESPGSFPDYSSTCLQVVPALFSGAQGSQQGSQPPPAKPLKQVAPKRSSSYLVSSPEPGPVEFPAPGGAARYSESSLKKKRVY
ncbi:hypothetical protein DUI87_15029 [Hirundo rustica rustica]|uniref:Uncharacterized protein n=1 Tax=Hirundo rustica rustica TaxID=333673 RepID=A0A3M0K6K1_HIRRU|nr:hypothetical protein DUI87_15029 [Hirundo rustica rustica]